MINKSLRKWNCESLVDLMEFGRRTLRTGRVLKKLRYQQANELSNHPAFTEKYRKKFLEMNPSKAKQIAKRDARIKALEQKEKSFNEWSKARADRGGGKATVQQRAANDDRLARHQRRRGVKSRGLIGVLDY
jgi:hypothetical protein